jgi:hypothetical protein
MYNKDVIYPTQLAKFNMEDKLEKEEMIWEFLS